MSMPKCSITISRTGRAVISSYEPQKSFEENATRLPGDQNNSPVLKKRSLPKGNGDVSVHNSNAKPIRDDQVRISGKPCQKKNPVIAKIQRD
jgi:hypothetical protein